MLTVGLCVFGYDAAAGIPYSRISDFCEIFSVKIETQTQFPIYNLIL